MEMLQVLVYFALVVQCLFQIPACPDGTTCSPNGLWSEWVSSGNGYCPTPCGSCSKILQTRQCISAQFGCPCTGNSTRSYPCNTLPCTYASQRTCCIPYISMNINGTLQCGPFEKTDFGAGSSDIGSDGGRCCVPGGIWTNWTEFGLTDDGSNQWIRTRNCLSASGGCPCDGPDTENKGTTCPCPPIGDLTNPSDYESGTGPAELGRPFYIVDTDCTATQYYNRSNYRPYTYCTTLNGANVTQVRMKLSDNTFTNIIPGPCQDGYWWSDQKFTCDLSTLFWRFGGTNQQITATGQINYL